MKALLLNSGVGRRMGVLSSEHPKCMTEISPRETLLSRQLRMLSEVGIREVVITTGPFEPLLRQYCDSLNLPLHLTFVNNPRCETTNYIYSIYCARELLDDDILLLHGDVVMENQVLDQLLDCAVSSMVVSSSLPLPDKDFKASILRDRIAGIGVDSQRLWAGLADSHDDAPGNVVAAQPVYFLKRHDWRVWLDRIIAFCQSDQVDCYAEEAFNQIWRDCALHPLDVGDLLVGEVDDPQDLAVMTQRLREVEQRTVYLCFSADLLHSGHLALLKKAGRLGQLIVGVLSDEAVTGYRRYPLLPFAERKSLLETLSGVWQVVEQRTLSYRENLLRFRPTYVVHGDDWKSGFQKPVRDEVVSLLASYGGILKEFPYADDPRYLELERRTMAELSLPDLRRRRLRQLLSLQKTVTALEAHSGITGLIAEKTVVYQDGGPRQFDSMWISSLCDSTARGKPDIELVDLSSRFRTVDDIMEVTTKPIIFDGDTGGMIEHFIYTVRTLERMGVSMIIIEDKTGLKKNSLFGTDVPQTQDSIEHFCAKISAGKQAQKSDDFMICARIESLILNQGMEDALTRAEAYVGAGADAIMIHSRKKDPAEIFAFVEQFRLVDPTTPVVVVPSSFSSVTEEEFRDRGVNLVIYANQLTRAGFPAMQAAAQSILEHHRAAECDELCMSIRDIITLIPEDN